MDLETLARLGEFVGGFVVMVSLVYLAHQVRQNTKSLRAENYARVLDRLSTLQSNLSSDADLNRIVTLGSRRPESLTAPERVRFSWALYETMGAAEFVFHQAREKAFPEEVWERWRTTLGWWISNPGIRRWWSSKPVPFTPDFESLMEELILHNPVDVGQVGRWEQFVSMGGPGPRLQDAGEAPMKSPVTPPPGG